MATTTTRKPDTLAAAFLKAQSEFPDIPKDGEATVKGTTKGGARYEYKYHYATLPAIFKAVKPVLHKHGLTITQTSDSGCLITALRHEGGEVLLSSIEMPSPLNMAPQEYGKAHSYYRRYEVNGMLGLAPDDDDDAQGIKAPPLVQPPIATPQPDTPAQVSSGSDTEKYLAAVSGLISRGTAALSTIGNWEDPDDEMAKRKTTVLGHEGYESETEITAKPARVEFYRALEVMVKAIETDAQAVKDVDF